MRIDRFDLTRYGHFNNASLTFPKPLNGPDLHIVFGPNEAGKSTLFSAWLDLLYGIPKRSGYAFLHGGAQMRIAAALSDGQTMLDVVRLKRDSASLQDAHGATLPEAVLQSLLGNLSREGYRAMFSLDDETLEQGGDSILASRGDLGELLFSASAGLSQLVPQLDAIRAELDEYHKPGGRKGALREGKARLAELEKQRKELDTSASALQRLMRDVATATRAWELASQAEDAKSAERRAVQAVVNLLPSRNRLTELQTKLSELVHLPDATEAHESRYAQLDAQQIALSSRIQDREGRILRLNDRLAALQADPDVLAQADAIMAAEGLRSAHDEALRDLPRRRSEADDADRDVQQTLTELGQPQADAATLVIDPARLSRLRTLLAQHSGIGTALAQSTSEASRATQKLTDERQRLGDPGPEDEQAALAQLLARLGQNDPAAALRDAVRDRDGAAARLQQAMAALAPWRGDAVTLADLPAPASWQIDAWKTEAETVRQTLADATRAVGQAEAALELAERAGVKDAAGFTLADAAEMRKRREAAWSAHRATLSADSADHFENALREDDRVSGMVAEAVAAAHRDAEILTLREALQRAHNQADAVRQAQQSHLSTVAAVAEALGLPDTPLPALSDWLDRRNVALLAANDLRTAEHAVARASDARSEAATTLQTVLSRPDPADFEVLRAEALARLEAADRRREARRTLAALEKDLASRNDDLHSAKSASQLWTEDWHGATQGSLLAGADLAYANRVLDLLDRLTKQLGVHAGLADRTAKMQANLDAFATVSANVITSLGMAATTRWPEVLARLQQAQETWQTTSRLQSELSTETEAIAEDQALALTNVQSLTALGAELGWDEQCPLRDHLGQAREASRLRDEAARLRTDLAGHPEADDDADPEELQARDAILARELELLRADTQARFHDLQEAKRRVTEVGGDDTVARIEAERANLQAAIADEVQRHLADRFGLIALEYGLRRYRDEHRSGMLTRASDAFRQITCNAYSGLSAEPDGSKEVLVASTVAGRTATVNEMSKGTRAQLYLALRMAGYHELAQTRPTVPFVADDIMETFDDGRSAEAFRLLGTMAETGQVIYLTHHQHLCDIAREVCPGARITDLRDL